ncbi:transcriptional regulator, ArsR family [Sphingomonas gellani]|uniref:Transcriptional regulator, ArsR family n=1 Tax=Sphingomonas gellani TaxID=1166340 RepID=A0A1H8AIQ9_9SPHN|nr:metalloregulator ArsR/SmtB family transcription factor [Sphingomonas gellani]SEM69689.1 transcriptional regulator, ArsR family [Sphingomonas gellani]
MARPRRRVDTDPIDRLLHALGDSTRRRMVEMLGTRPHAVTTMADLCGITLTAVGQHVRILEEAGLVTSSKLGRVRSCQLDPNGLETLQRWLAARRSTWEKRLDALGALLVVDEKE